MSVQVKASVRQVSETASEASVRSHKSLVDRPQAKGGGDRGPMGGELLLMGVGGCFMSNLLAAAKARSVAVADLVVDVTATLDAAPSRFSALTLRVGGRYGDRAAMQDIVASAEQDCIAINTVRGAAKVSIELA